jgi:hypothetical protein
MLSRQAYMPAYALCFVGRNFSDYEGLAVAAVHGTTSVNFTKKWAAAWGPCKRCKLC